MRLNKRLLILEDEVFTDQRMMVMLEYFLTDRKDSQIEWIGQIVIMMKYSLGGHSPSHVFLSTFFCNHYV